MKINNLKKSFLRGCLILAVSFSAGANSMNIKADLFAGDEPVYHAEESLELTLKDQNGNTLELEELRGKVVFINFWATWCPPCIVEMPDINDLYKELEEDDDIVFLMISLDQSFDKAKQFLEKKGFDFNIYKVEGSIPKELQTQAIPTTFVVDTEGHIAQKHLGAQSYNTDAFKNFLKGLKE